MFRDANVGDKIYCYPMGKMVTIKAIFKNRNFPLLLSDGNTINYKGCVYEEDANPTYFWNKVQITPPPKPKKKVKKTVEGWANIYHLNPDGVTQLFLHNTKESAEKCNVKCEGVCAAPATLTYEIEE